MAGTDGLLDELITDAKRVAAYGQRTGRLRDYELISAISAVDDLANPRWGEPAVVALQGTLNRAMQNIAPTTLADLRNEKWKPMEPRKWWPTELQQLLFVLFSLALLYATGTSTLRYNQGTELAINIERLLLEKTSTDVIGIAQQLENPQLTAEVRFNLGGQLNEIADEYDSYQSKVSIFVESASAFEESIANLMNFGTSRDTIEAVGAKMKVNLDALPQGDSCSANGAPRIAAADGITSAVVSMDKQVGFRATLIAILCKEGMNPGALFEFARYAGLVYYLKLYLENWGSLLLPAFYGAFGATIYYLRRILDPALPDPSLARFIHRVAMGAFAGVIVTWFWAPNDQVFNSFTTIGLTLFTVAFLAGFSVDVLFVLLDRMVSVAMTVAKGADTRPTLAAPIYISNDNPATLAAGATSANATKTGAGGSAAAPEQPAAKPKTGPAPSPKRRSNPPR